VKLLRKSRPFWKLLGEDTWALNEGVIDEEGSLKQACLNFQEREAAASIRPTPPTRARRRRSTAA